MSLAREYAEALDGLVLQTPSEGTTYLRNAAEVLRRRGHLRLLPQIYAEYQRIVLRRQRREEQEKVTPESERTRVLLELYRKLIQA